MIGWLLNNDVSRNILKLLFEQNMTANEIAKKKQENQGFRSWSRRIPSNPLKSLMI
jgi:hypothetical protein